MAIQPVISIITIVYNGAALLEGTINSIQSQTYPNIEYLIVDGGSSDGTLNIIKNHASAITHWISEPDQGLYDAMNKGIKMATGDFLWFMNCGDQIYAADTVEQMVTQCQADTDILYGEVMLVDEQRQELGTRSTCTVQKLPARLKWQDMAKGMVVCHQGFLPRREIAPLYMENNLTADIEWVIQCLKKSKNTTPTSLILATYLTGGISKQHHRQSLKDRYVVLQKHFGFWGNLRNHFLIVLRGILNRNKY